MPKRKPHDKVGNLKLTSDQLKILAEARDTELFKLITEVILPQRRVQVALTNLGGSTTVEDLWYYKGMAYAFKWLPDFITDATKNLDDVIFENDDDGENAEDDTSV